MPKLRKGKYGVSDFFSSYKHRIVDAYKLPVSHVYKVCPEILPAHCDVSGSIA